MNRLPRRPAFLAAVAALSLITASRAAAGPEPVDPGYGLATIRLWEGGAPGALGTADDDVPTLTVFPPQSGKGIGTGVVIAPGGGYLGLASNLEGRQVADWFAARGVTAFVLRYRLGARYLYPVPLQDAERAVRLARSLAGAYGLSPARIGMVGFSAGGHLAAMTGTVFDAGNPSAPDPVDRVSSRPDFLVLGYPWLEAMLPSKPTYIPRYQVLMKLPLERHEAFEKPYTPVFHVTAGTPPCFIFITSDDHTVQVQSSVAFYSALKEAGVPAEMHVFQHGSHGVGLGAGDPALDLWPLLLEQWLRGQGLLAPPSQAGRG
jgi:acetyl esterase/lipase